MTGGVYSACGAMKSIVARMGAGQPSQWASIFCPGLSVAMAVSGTKKRTRRRASGSRLATGAPAATHSPGR